MYYIDTDEVNLSNVLHWILNITHIHILGTIHSQPLQQRLTQCAWSHGISWNSRHWNTIDKHTQNMAEAPKEAELVLTEVPFSDTSKPKFQCTIILKMLKWIAVMSKATIYRKYIVFLNADLDTLKAFLTFNKTQVIILGRKRKLRCLIRRLWEQGCKLFCVEGNNSLRSKKLRCWAFSSQQTAWEQSWP